MLYVYPPILSTHLRVLELLVLQLNQMDMIWSGQSKLRTLAGPESLGEWVAYITLMTIGQVQPILPHLLAVRALSHDVCSAVLVVNACS